MQDILIKLLADGMVVPVVLIGTWTLVFGIRRGEHYQAYCRILLAGLTSYLCAKLIGSVFQPELVRPFELLGVEARASFLNNPGFPSDHVLFCAAITLAVWFETRRTKVAILLGVSTLLVGIGRILALVHSPLDVAGGVLMAGIGALWYLQRDASIKPIGRRQWSKPEKAGKIS